MIVISLFDLILKKNLLHFTVLTALTLLLEFQEGHLACKKTEWWGAGIVICLG